MGRRDGRGERISARWTVKRQWQKSRPKVLTGIWATQWQWGWKERISSGDGLGEDSGNGRHHLLRPAHFSKCDVTGSPAAFPAPGQVLLQVLGGRVPSSRASFTRALSPGSSGARTKLPEAQPWSLATATPDSVYSVLGDPPQTSGPPNSSPGAQLLAPTQECSEVAGWCGSAPCQPPKGKRHPPRSRSLVQALVVVVV